jgi:NTP pyrophosphatase (non-canonical NTP hydrolase)
VIEVVLTVATWLTRCTDKEQVCKLGEETMEAYAAWERLDATTCLVGRCALDDYSLHEARLDLADELADVITAACNLAQHYSIDMRAAMRRCEQRNRERGRL